ncbi:hypothetical protein BCV70DRAFT_112637 [Testicularia cyperi]|uniref:Uncharacterized protein n=1 Tax=Testicularia cyperi TaxID=1882483 RepID=A0A317XPK5_9BASI|nr:hypothetical protein BCV70DRAFT_112637 [Testicularia cyperi]
MQMSQRGKCRAVRCSAFLILTVFPSELLCISHSDSLPLWDICISLHPLSLSTSLVGSGNTIISPIVLIKRRRLFFAYAPSSLPYMDNAPPTFSLSIWPPRRDHILDHYWPVHPLSRGLSAALLGTITSIPRSCSLMFALFHVALFVTMQLQKKNIFAHRSELLF